jgi:hypothetical protein
LDSLPIRLCITVHVVQINKLVREIEVSHWGNIYVEESYEIVSDCCWNLPGVSVDATLHRYPAGAAAATLHGCVQHPCS